MVTLGQNAANYCKSRPDHTLPAYNPIGTCTSWGNIFPGDDYDGKPFGGNYGSACNWDTSGKPFMVKTGQYQTYCRYVDGVMMEVEGITFCNATI